MTIILWMDETARRAIVEKGCEATQFPQHKKLSSRLGLLEQNHHFDKRKHKSLKTSH
jgi:hypothetical protein